MTQTNYIIVGGIILLGFAYWFFLWDPTPEIPITATENAVPAEQQFLELASTLDSIRLDTSIFSDQRFLSLQSIAKAVVDELQGREDPFAPLR